MSNTLLNTIKDEIIAICKKNNVTISPVVVYEGDDYEYTRKIEESDENDAKINCIIHSRIKKLTKSETDEILCQYGIMKSFKLFHDYHKIGLKDTYEDFSECFECEDYGVITEIIELMINDLIGFHNDWRNAH